MSKNTKQKSSGIILLMILFSMALCWVLFLPYTIRYHDFYFHITRVEQLVIAFKNGDWFPRIFPHMYDNFGYAVSLFYSDFFLYIPALLTYIGVEVLLSYKIYSVIIVLATVFSSYYCVNKLLKDRFSAAVAAMVYTGSSYFAVDMFIRGALGESQAFIFLPFALLGMYNAVYGDKNDRWPLIIGFSGLVLSHNLSLLLTAIFFAIFLVINLRKLIKEPVRILEIAKSSITVVLLTAFFFLPMAEQLLTEEFFSTYHASIWNPIVAVIAIRRLFLGGNLDDRTMFTPSMGLTILIVFVLCMLLFFKKPKNDLHRFFDCLILGSGLCMFVCTRYFPWVALDPHLNIIQFPWRMYVFITLFASFCIGILSNKYVGNCNTKFKNIIICLIAVFCFAQFSCTAYTGLQIFKSQDRIVTDTSSFRIGDENYLHGNNNRKKWANRWKYVDTATGVNGDVTTSMTRDYYNRYIEFSDNDTNNSLEIAAIYFRGYKAVDADTGEKYKVYPSKDGWLEVDIGTKESGRINVFYDGTFIQHISPFISLATVAVIIFITLKKKRNFSDKEI